MAQIEKALPAYLTKKQLAYHFGVSERTVNEFLKRGLPHFRIGHKILRFKRTEAEEWFERFRTDEEDFVERIVEEVMGSFAKPQRPKPNKGSRAGGKVAKIPSRRIR